MATRLAGSPSGSGTSTAPSTRPPRSTTSRRQRSTRTDLASSTTSPTPLCRPRYEPGTDLADEPRQGRQQWVRTRSKSIGSALCRMRDRSLPPADLQRRPIFNVDYELSGAAERYGFDLRWHSGSELAVKDIPVDFRGPAMPEAGRRVALLTGSSMLPQSEGRHDWLSWDLHCLGAIRRSRSSSFSSTCGTQSSHTGTMLYRAR